MSKPAFILLVALLAVTLLPHEVEAGATIHWISGLVEVDASTLSLMSPAELVAWVLALLGVA